MQISPEALNRLPPNHPMRRRMEGMTEQPISQKVNNIKRNIQSSLDAFARTRDYDSMLSACSYAGSTVPKFAADAAKCIALRDQTWATAEAILADVKAGNRPFPELTAVMLELPTLTWE